MKIQERLCLTHDTDNLGQTYDDFQIPGKGKFITNHLLSLCNIKLHRDIRYSKMSII